MKKYKVVWRFLAEDPQYSRTDIICADSEATAEEIAKFVFSCPSGCTVVIESVEEISNNE